ncbi:TetR/AcrR family transcriptional regulator [Arthrobacter sp. TMN-49]
MSDSFPDQRLELPDKSFTGERLGRRYSGLESAERVLERQRRLVAAGIDVFGTVGYAASKVKTLCQSAGLSERYFYESFESREHLLQTVYTHLDALLTARMACAMRTPGLDLFASVRAGIDEAVAFMLGDPRHAQIILVEVVGISAGLEAKRHQTMIDFAEESMLQLLLLSGIDPEHGRAQLTARLGTAEAANIFEFARLTTVAVVGGVNNMLLDALLGGTTDHAERIGEAAFQLIDNASRGIRALVAS